MEQEKETGMIAAQKAEIARLIDQNARVTALAMRLAAELRHSHTIIGVQLNEMTIQQKFALGHKTADIAPDGITRANEREALLKESAWLGSERQVAAQGEVAAFNLNEQFTVTLTAFGAKQRNDHYAFVRNARADIAPPLSSEGDVLTEPLWELFKVFGPSISHAMPEVPFVGNAIRALRFTDQTDGGKGGADHG